MQREPDRRPQNTRRMRLKGFDYRTPGYYFITICQQERRSLFATIRTNGHVLTPSGSMIRAVTLELEKHFDHAVVDASVIMPNHVHVLLGMNLDEGDYARDSVTDVIHWWKTQTTVRYGDGVRSHQWPRYKHRLWQEGYHDRIVRDQRELEYIRYYIEQNPKRWAEDTFYES